jgi:hypothetical protein
MQELYRVEWNGKWRWWEAKYLKVSGHAILEGTFSLFVRKDLGSQENLTEDSR